ncbi:uncharacterized protein [Lolium perenne]|uniref:uncharacterized protein isoform X1 n=1 Tax=Lolium perenne TaxID=4522 RepID=UPI003A99BC38
MICWMLAPGSFCCITVGQKNSVRDSVSSSLSPTKKSASLPMNCYVASSCSREASLRFVQTEGEEGSGGCANICFQTLFRCTRVVLRSPLILLLIPLLGGSLMLYRRHFLGRVPLILAFTWTLLMMNLLLGCCVHLLIRSLLRRLLLVILSMVVILGLDHFRPCLLITCLLRRHCHQVRDLALHIQEI